MIHHRLEPGDRLTINPTLGPRLVLEFGANDIPILEEVLDKAWAKIREGLDFDKRYNMGSNSKDKNCLKVVELLMDICAEQPECR